MDYIFSILGPTGYLVVTVFLFIVAVLWFLIPFAIFGIKGLLKEMIAEQRLTNEMLQTLSRQNIPARSAQA
jgi:ABC-type Na+ efflux pump permease subunit